MSGHASSNSPRALVTGATGFLGSHLTRHLVAKGWQVTALVRPESSWRAIEELRGQIAVSTLPATGDALLQLLREAAPDVVFHLASCFLAEHAHEDLERLITSNVLFGTRLLDGACRAGVRRFVNVSTAWVHWKNAAYEPVNLYAATKQALIDILAYYVSAFPLSAVTLELGDTYGPRDPRNKLIPLLHRAMQSGAALEMSPGEQFVDLVFVDDVVEAFLVAADRLQANHVPGHTCYAIRSGQPVQLRELVRIAAEIAGVELPIQWGVRPYRQREVMLPVTQGESLPGWQPKVGLRDGLALTWRAHSSASHDLTR